MAFTGHFHIICSYGLSPYRKFAPHVELIKGEGTKVAQLAQFTLLVMTGRKIYQLGVIAKKSQDFCGNPYRYQPAVVTFAKLKNDCDLPN